MKDYLKVYINKLFSYIPVSIFIFTIVFFSLILPSVDALKIEYGNDAIDVFIDLYMFHFIRALLLTLFIPLYDSVLSSGKFTYKTSIILHGILVNITVAILFYQPGMTIQNLLFIHGLGILIYVVIWIVIFIREKQFVNNANEIFKENKE